MHKRTTCDRNFCCNSGYKVRLRNSTEILRRFPINKVRKFHVLNGTVQSGCTDPTLATARFVIMASRQTQNYALKEKSKYCLYPKDHSAVEKGRWKTKGGGILSCRKPLNASEGKKFS